MALCEDPFQQEPQQSTLNTIAKAFAGFRNAALESTGRFSFDSALFVAGLEISYSPFPPRIYL